MKSSLGSAELMNGGVWQLTEKSHHVDKNKQINQYLVHAHHYHFDTHVHTQTETPHEWKQNASSTLEAGN